MSLNRVIGINNKLPWHISEDLKRFKQLTTGHPIIMGRKTYESIGKPLPGRQNIIISRTLDLKINGVDVVNSIESALEICGNESLIFIIGGEQIYKIAMPFATHLNITEVESTVNGDAYFPNFKKNEWLEINREKILDEKGFNFSFVDYERKT